ncbi:hypothetical protein CCACVL1_08268 [Corchorus capsularis]|uniref:Uncharacterized protein n=1 Tax=Corchorus capsularis TaxID=210143 RepID=A0A1R3J1J6_COCAP|nr:hypothetical protein CCACVL1_08268 [Corchorus capsularis]
MENKKWQRNLQRITRVHWKQKPIVEDIKTQQSVPDDWFL